jgi:molybdopterin molybdotransferase
LNFPLFTFDSPSKIMSESHLYSVDEATARILTGIRQLPEEPVELLAAFGRVLAEDVQSGISLPPFANSSMDGYAVCAADISAATQNDPVRLNVVMDIPAGTAPEGLIQAGQAARIMTGAPLPEGADAVVPVEKTDQSWRGSGDSSLSGTVAVFSSVGAGDYVRRVGEDIQSGQTVLSAGTVIRAQELGVLAGIGRAQVSVIRQPRVAILSTGDELVPVDHPLSPGKIRDTNSYTLYGLVLTYGGIPLVIPTAGDTVESVRRRFHEALDQQPDLIISSAGVSVGAFDVVRAVLAEMGHIDFWRVNLRPGKPLAYGFLQGVPFFGLPGNPVSAMVTYDVFVRPVLLKMTGRPDALPTVQALAGESLHSDGRRSYLRVILSRENGQLIARTTGTQSSGALMSMAQADGLLIIPEGITEVEIGQQFAIRLLRSLE